MSFSTSAISESRNSTWPHGRIDRLALGERQLLLGQPPPALDAKQIRRRRAVLQTAHQHRVDLVLDPRARPDQLRATREAPTHRADALIGRPGPVELPRPQQLGQRPRVEAIGLGSGLADPGVARRDDDHPRYMRLEDPRDRPRIARHLQRDPVARIQALREQLQRLRCALDPPRRAQPALGDDRHLTDIAMDIQRYRPHPVLLSVDDERKPVGKRHRPIRARSATGQVAGAATEKPGLQAHRPKRPAQPCVPQKAPRPGPPNLSPPPDATGAFKEQFHATTSRSAGRRCWSSTRGARRSWGRARRTTATDRPRVPGARRAATGRARATERLAIWRWESR